jgi:hypothetical protein
MPFISNDPNQFVAVGMQSGQGTPQVAQAKFRFVRSLAGTKVDSVQEIVDLREGGDGMDPSWHYQKTQKFTGQLVANLRPEIAGAIFQFLPGYASWLGGTQIPTNIQVFSTNHASLPWGTLVFQHPGSSLLQAISDVRFTELTLEGKPGEPILMTVPFTAIGDTVVASAYTPTNYGEDAFLYQGATILLNGALASGITSWKIGLKYKVDELYAQNLTLDTIVPLNRDITLEFTRRYENPTLWSIIAMDGGNSPSYSAPTGSFDVYQTVGGSASGIVRFSLPLLSYHGITLTEIDPDGKTIIETVQAGALKGATHAMLVQLNNAHASAYSS